MRDQVYHRNQSQIVDFAFNEEVTAVFPDMIRRSVPGYETVIPMTGLIAARHLADHGHAFDLGCSLGATTLAILSQNNSSDVQVTGVDSSPSMIAGAKAAIGDKRANFVEQDLRQTDVTDAKVIVLNLVLQFIDPAERPATLTKLAKQMSPDGLLIVSEKVRHTDPDLLNFFDQTHLAWKKANGYSDLEVSQKRNALENVMKIDTEEDHIERFRAVGFGQITQWYRCMNWASFLVRL